MTETLPQFIPPMLAKLGEPFDSDAYLFELKWDGMRAQAFVEHGQVRAANRNRVALAERFPELSVLAALPPGIALDGELVVLKNGKPDLASCMTRQHAHGKARSAALAKQLPATYVVFDLLYDNFEPLLAQPLERRRARLEDLLRGLPPDKVVVSQGLVGRGLALFAQANANALEGIVAKRLDSAYLPGKRSDAWVKIKRRSEAHCVIVGFEPDGARGFKSLIIAREEQGTLRCVGQVGSGLDDAMHAWLNGWLWAHRRAEPIVPCGGVKGIWVEPELLCLVSYLEDTAQGNLRAPVFERLLAGRDDT